MTEEVKKSIKKNAYTATSIRFSAMNDSLEFVIEMGEINELEDKELKSVEDEIYALEHTSMVTNVKDLKYRLNDALRFVMNARKLNRLHKESNNLDHKCIAINELLSAVEMLQRCSEMLREHYNWGEYFNDIV